MDNNIIVVLDNIINTAGEIISDEVSWLNVGFLEYLGKELEDFKESFREDETIGEKLMNSRWITSNGNKILINEENGERLAGQPKAYGDEPFKQWKSQHMEITKDKIGKPVTRFYRGENALYIPKEIKVKDDKGLIATVCEGKITNINIIGGKGAITERGVDVLGNLLKQCGGKADDWRKCKGVGYAIVRGKKHLCDIHWFEEPTVGQVRMKIKKVVE